MQFQGSSRAHSGQLPNSFLFPGRFRALPGQFPTQYPGVSGHFPGNSRATSRAVTEQFPVSRHCPCSTGRNSRVVPEQFADSFPFPRRFRAISAQFPNKIPGIFQAASGQFPVPGSLLVVPGAIPGQLSNNFPFSMGLRAHSRQ